MLEEKAGSLLVRLVKNPHHGALALNTKRDYVNLAVTVAAAAVKMDGYAPAV